MSTYRTGNHWGVTIVRETEAPSASGYVCDGCGDQAEVWIDERPLCRREPEVPTAQLVAVVVNGDQALAERICALLNREETADRVVVYPQTGEPRGYPPRGDAPSARPISPVSASDASGVPGCGLDRSEAAQTISVGVECKLVRPAGPGPTEPCACPVSQPCALGTVI